MKKGFTLIELLVVIVVIGILASLATVAINSARVKTRDAKRISDIKQIQTALEIYKNDINNYPVAVTSGNSLVYNTQTYMKTVPAAPGKLDGACATDVYTYTYYPVTGIYEITYCLGGVVNGIGPGNAKAMPGNIYTFVPAEFACGVSVVTGKSPDMEVYGTVIGADGKCWLNRNLGATRFAQSSNDYLSYGSLFQWGRAADSHQLITWTSATAGTPQYGTTATKAEVPGDGLFITSTSDWRITPSSTLWQNSSSANNPCPTGWHVPTETEWGAIAGPGKTITGTATAYSSTLKLPVTGNRAYNSGSLNDAGSFGGYWSSTVDSSLSRYLYFGSGSVGMYSGGRAYGFSIRCIQD